MSSEKKKNTDYLRELPELTEAQRWDTLDERFREMVETVEALHLEEGAEAFGIKVEEKWESTGPKWRDDSIRARTKDATETGLEVRPWFQIQYTSEEDFQDLSDRIRDFESLLPIVEQGLKKRAANVEFASVWGWFSYLAGYVCHAYFFDIEDIQSKRRALGRRQDEQKIWIAHALKKLGFPDKTQRKVAEGMIVDHVKAAMVDEKLRGKIDEEWFRRLLSPKGDGLRSTFSGNFGKKEVLKFAKHDADGLPPLP